jgi:hypothetical protein
MLFWLTIFRSVWLLFLLWLTIFWLEWIVNQLIFSTSRNCRLRSTDHSRTIGIIISFQKPQLGKRSKSSINIEVNIFGFIYLSLFFSFLFIYLIHENRLYYTESNNAGTIVIQKPEVRWKTKKNILIL